MFLRNSLIMTKTEMYRKPGQGLSKVESLLVEHGLILLLPFLTIRFFFPIVSILVAFIIFSRQLQTFGDMWRPALLVGIINFIWFGGNWIINLSGRGRDRKAKSRRLRRDKARER